MKYTTGEIAKICGVSVRTVQYYDTRGIVAPSELSDGGRRLYSEADLDKMKIVCYLRDLEIPIDSIKKLFSEKEPETVIATLLDEQENIIRYEISQKVKNAERIAETKKSLKRMSAVSVSSIKDAAHIVENKRQMKRLRTVMLIIGFVMDALQAAGLMIWIFRGIWWPFLLCLFAAVALGVWISLFYYRNTAYICPHCHTVFTPTFRDTLFASHTPNTRKLTCTACGERGFCIETYGGKNA